MERDVYYIVVAMLFASIALSTVFFLAWRTLGHKPYALSWSLGFLAAALQWFCNLNPQLFPSFEVYWITVNAFALVLITLGVRGHCQRTGCTTLPANLWPYSAALLAVIAWATAIEPHAGVRMAVVPAVASATLIWSALLVVQHRQQPRPAEWAAAVSLILFAVAQGIAAGMSALQGKGVDESYLVLYQQFNFLTLPAGYIATGMFVILVLASDISEEMKEIAVRDQLTGVYDRRGLAEQGAMAYATARRNDATLSVVMTDIDRFKDINDRFGHATGDLALCHFAEILRDTRRADDVLARVGGEEFALVLPGTGLEEALRIADRLCARIESTPMRVGDRNLDMTASFGVAMLNDKDTCLSDTIVRADRALYRSKRAGRNQVDLESSQLMLAEDGTLKPISA